MSCRLMNTLAFVGKKTPYDLYQSQLKNSLNSDKYS